MYLKLQRLTCVLTDVSQEMLTSGERLPAEVASMRGGARVPLHVGYQMFFTTENLHANVTFEVGFVGPQMRVKMVFPGKLFRAQMALMRIRTCKNTRYTIYKL